MQIGDENVHRVRALMDEVFGEENFVAQIIVQEDQLAQHLEFLAACIDYVLWYARRRDEH